MRIATITKIIFIIFIIIMILFFLLLIILIEINSNQNNFSKNIYFNGEKAYKDVEYQISLGPRIPGSTSHDQTTNWIIKTLDQNNWKPKIFTDNVADIKISNIIGSQGKGRPWIIIGAHYDSRIFADRDKLEANQILPVPGANDGASGVAILLELSRIIDRNILEQSWAKQIWLVFFDAEDNGNIPGWSWIMGSQSFADSLTENPDLVVILDMVGDADLNIYQEVNSDKKYRDEIWRIAAQLGYEKYFISEVKYNIIDDHIPFIQRGIPAVDIIDFDYPYWHTISDTSDKVSAQSLAIVGNTILTWLITP